MRGLCMLLAMLVFCSVAVGQDFGQLLKAVRKVETNLKQMIEEERATRESQVAALRGDIDNMAGISGSSPKLQAELNSLRAELDAIKDVVDETNSGHAVAYSQRASAMPWVIWPNYEPNIRLTTTTLPTSLSCNWRSVFDNMVSN